MDKMVDKIITEIKANTASNRKKSRYSKNSSAIKSKNRSIVSKDVSESKDSIYWEQNPDFNKKQNYNNSHVKSVSHAPDAEKVLDSNEYIIQNNMSDNNPDDIDLDDSITLTERLDEVKDNIYKEVDNVKFKIKEINTNLESINKNIEQLSKQFDEENKARSAEIFNIISEVQESKSERQSTYAHSQMGRLNSIERDPSFGMKKNSKISILHKDDIQNIKKQKALDTSNQHDVNILGTSREILIRNSKHSDKPGSTEKYFIKTYDKDAGEISTRLKLNYIRDKGRKANKFNTRNKQAGTFKNKAISYSKDSNEDQNTLPDILKIKNYDMLG